MKRTWKSLSATGTRLLAAGTILAIGLVAPAPIALSQAPEPVPFGEADFSGSGTGTVIHADFLQSDDTRLEDTEVAFSGAAVDSQGLTPRQLNEVQREFQPNLPEKNAYGRGSGLEIGLGVTPDDENQVIVAGKAEADAPPPTDLVTEEIGPLPADPLAYAALLRGQAEADYRADGICTLGNDLSFGLGYAADAQLLDAGGDESDDDTLDEPVLAADAPDPERAVSQSRSRTTLVGQFAPDGTKLGDNFGLMSEVRETIAPVTFFKNTENEFTVEFLGEWVLQAVATGLDGGAYIHYGPGEVSPETPILRVIQPDGTTDSITTQDFLGDEGLDVTIPGLAEIVIGEDPRAIGGDATTEPTEAADGTEASAAVDVVRVKLLEQTDETGEVTARASQVRVGHMEVQTQVPRGGISCELPVTKTPDPIEVNIDSEEESAAFTTRIVVENPFDCDLASVRLTDDIWTEQGAVFSVTGTSPPADQVPSSEETFQGGTEEDPATTIVWNDIGPIPIDESAVVTVDLLAFDAGTIHDLATATATSLENCEGEDATVAGVAIGIEQANVTGQARAQVPSAEVLGERPERALPRTGPTSGTVLLSGLALAGLAGLGYTAGRRYLS